MPTLGKGCYIAGASMRNRKVGDLCTPAVWSGSDPVDKSNSNFPAPFIITSDT